MRSKLITGAVVASASLAVAGGAAAYQAPGQITLNATASPSDAGTSSQPKNVAMRFNVDVARPGTTVEVIELSLAKGLRFSGKGFKRCTEDKEAISQGSATCPSGSKAGPRGSATALIEPANSSLDFSVYPYVHDSKTFYFYLKGINGNSVNTVLEGDITNRGRKLTITIPFELRQPLAGLNATLTGIDQKFSAKRGRNYVVASTGCSNRRWEIKARLIYATRSDNAVVPPPSNLTDRLRCSK